MSWFDSIKRLLGLKRAHKAPRDNDLRIYPVQSAKRTQSLRPSPTTTSNDKFKKRENERTFEEPKFSEVTSSLPAEERRVPPAPTPPLFGQIDKISSPPLFDSPKEPVPVKGDITQIPAIKPWGPKQQIIIGLDFGTAFTKVVIGEVRISYAVPFMSAKNENPYLLASVFRVNLNGECFFAHDVAASGKLVTNLKMKLLESNASMEDLINIVAYLALVFRHCRWWLIENHRLTYEGKYLDWYVNVGLPTDSYHHEALTTTYHKLVRAAWALSIIPDGVTINGAEKMISCIERGERLIGDDHLNLKERLIHPDMIGLFPEFVAQIAGYVQSTLKKNDLHLMVDVGAGTIDISVFNVHGEEGEHRYPIFAKALMPLGTHYLMKHRAEKVATNAFNHWNVQDRTPSRDEFASLGGISIEQVKSIDEIFSSKFGKTLSGLLKYSKEFRYPNSTRWLEGIPTFLCGGGGMVDVYLELLQRIEANRNHSRRIRLEKLPKPERLKAPSIADDDYHRLMVAYGLSFNALDLGVIIKESEVEDDRLQRRGINPYDRYIDKDMV